MKFRSTNNLDSNSIEFEAKTLTLAKTKAFHYFREYDSSTIIMIHNRAKLICSKKKSDRFWTDGMRSKRNYNSHKTLPVSLLEKRLERLELKKVSLFAEIEKVNRHLELTKADIEAYKKTARRKPS